MKVVGIKYCGCGCGVVVPLDKRHFETNGKFYICNHQRRGTKISAEARKHMGKSMKGKHHSEETKRKMSLAHKGKHPCIEAMKQRMKDVSNALWADPKHRAKMSKVWLGRKHTKETIEKLKIAAKARMTDEVREKISKTLMGNVQPEEVNQKRSATLKKRWANMEEKQRLLKLIRGNKVSLPTKPERKVRRILDRMFPGEYKYVGDEKVWIGGKNPDFMNVNGQKKLIEVFGDYWHGSEMTGVPNKVHRKERQEHFSEYGFKTLVIWTHQLKDISKVKERLEQFHIS